MARIKNDDFQKISKERNSIHEIVEATYCVFEDDGQRYFQIDTYGRNARKIPGKVSQSLQFDQAMAKSLVHILIQEFNLYGLSVDIDSSGVGSSGR